jgi:hypothetical protein
LEECQASLDDQSPSTSTSQDPEYNVPTKRAKRTTHVTLNAPRDILSSQKVQEEVVRCGLSLAQTVALVSAFIVTCNGDINEFVLSMDTQKRRKSQAISEMATHEREDYKLPESVVLRWDEKKGGYQDQVLNYLNFCVLWIFSLFQANRLGREKPTIGCLYTLY